jgi:hypothetical protein
MATTKTKKNTEEKKEETANKKSHPLIKKARITEKSAIYAEKGIYTFDVPLSANKMKLKKLLRKFMV